MKRAPRRAEMLATLVAAVRDARDVIARRHDAADVSRQALRDEIGKLRDEISELADATRAVLSHQRAPEPPAPPAAKASPATAATSKPAPSKAARP